MKISGYVTEPCKRGKFEDGTLGTCRRSLLWDRVICKSISGHGDSVLSDNEYT